MRRGLLLLALAGAVVAPAACGDDDDDATAGTGGSHTVAITAEGFQPRKLTIRVGDRVRFVNRSNRPESARTAGVDPSPGNGPTDHSGRDVNYGTARGFATHGLFPGEGQTIVFRVPRRYDYASTFPPFIRGVVVVER